MVERGPVFSAAIKENEESFLISELETCVGNLLKTDSQYSSEPLFTSDENKLRIYHAGPEIRLTFSIPRQEVKTGRESIFIELVHEGEHYHITGVKDPNTANFEFKSFEIFRENGPVKGYRKSTIRKEIIEFAIETLKI